MEPSDPLVVPHSFLRCCCLMQVQLFGGILKASWALNCKGHSKCHIKIHKQIYLAMPAHLRSSLLKRPRFKKWLLLKGPS